MKKSLAVLVYGLTLAACTPTGVNVTSTPIGDLPIDVFTLSNTNGMEVRIMEYGATILSIRVPDQNGTIDDVTLGFDSLADYLTSPRYFGAVVGRYGNRIARGHLSIDGQTYELARNNGPNHLHGGQRGFDKVVRQGASFQRGDTAGVALRYTSAAGQEGYPGTLPASVTYTLTPTNELVVDYAATTDAPTVVNLTQHTFFNLAGAGTRDVLDHELLLHASRFTPVDSTSIPTGELAAVAGTRFDFRTARRIGAGIADHAQLRQSNGYNHNFVLDRKSAGLMLAAHVSEPTSGRTLDVLTTEPGIQFFTGHSLDGSAPGKGGAPITNTMASAWRRSTVRTHPTNHPSPRRCSDRARPTARQTVFRFGLSPVRLTAG